MGTNLNKENSISMVKVMETQTLTDLTSQLQVQGYTKINISFKTNRVTVGYCQNGHTYGVRGNTLSEALESAIQLLQGGFNLRKEVCHE